jgi:hypothetical protein
VQTLVIKLCYQGVSVSQSRAAEICAKILANASNNQETRSDAWRCLLFVYQSSGSHNKEQDPVLLRVLDSLVDSNDPIQHNLLLTILDTCPSLNLSRLAKNTPLINHLEACIRMNNNTNYDATTMNFYARAVDLVGKLKSIVTFSQDIQELVELEEKHSTLSLRDCIIQIEKIYGTNGGKGPLAHSALAHVFSALESKKILMEDRLSIFMLLNKLSLIPGHVVDTLARVLYLNREKQVRYEVLLFLKISLEFGHFSHLDNDIVKFVEKLVEMETFVKELSSSITPRDKCQLLEKLLSETKENSEYTLSIGCLETMQCLIEENDDDDDNDKRKLLTLICDTLSK